MLVFCGMPLVFMELAFGQFASLGPITVWKAAPLFKGVGYAMVLISALVSIYYNMVTAWALHFLFTSLTSRLPWGFCNNTWNTAREYGCRVTQRRCSVFIRDFPTCPGASATTPGTPRVSMAAAEGQII